MNKYTIDKLEYEDLLDFSLNRPGYDVVIDLFTVNVGAVDDANIRDEFSEIAQEWENNRDIWVAGFRGELTLAKRKELVDLVYEVAKDETKNS